MINQKIEKTQRQIDMEGFVFNNMIRLGKSWFGDYMKLTTNDTIYDCLYSDYIKKDYSEARQWYKVALFRLLNGIASTQGNSKGVMVKLNKIKL